VCQGVGIGDVAVGTHQPQAGIVGVTALQSVPAGRHDVNGDGDLVTVEKLRERLPVGALTRLWNAVLTPLIVGAC
jgi:hypothetical protein